MSDDIREIDWGPDGVSWVVKDFRGRTDRLAQRHIEQARLRQAVYEATHPRITAKHLARLAGVNEGTLRAFANGERTPQPDVLAQIEAALERANGEVNA